MRHPPDRWAVLGPFVAIYALLWSQFAWVEATNFQGFDEWLTLSLTSSGIVDVPHANRPLGLLWNLLPAFLAPHSLRGVFFFYVHALALTAFLVFLICRRLLPEPPELAFLAGAFTASWAPSDPLRLTALYSTAYAGAALGVWLAVYLLLESRERGRLVLLAPAVVVAAATIRVHEGVIPLLVFAPVLLALAPSHEPRWWRWAWVWEGAVLGAAALALLPMLLSSDSSEYQIGHLKLDLDPVRLAERLAAQYSHHLGPVFGGGPHQETRSGMAAGLAFGAFGLGCWTALRGRTSDSTAPWTRRRLLYALGIGFVAAGLGYSGFILTAGVQDAERTQFFSAAGMALVLASVLCLAASRQSRALSLVLLATLGGFLVTTATSRTLSWQRHWDRTGRHAAQRQLLRELTREAPNLRPHTLVLLVDDSDSWRAVFSFRHAIEYMYPGRAVGHLWGGWEIFYPAAFTPQGVHCRPWPILRVPWRAPETVYGYHEILVARQESGGRVSVLRDWPLGILPPLPPGAAYDPLARIDPDTRLPAARRLLSER